MRGPRAPAGPACRKDVVKGSQWRQRESMAHGVKKP